MTGKQSFLYRPFNVNALWAIFFLWIFLIEIKVQRTNPANLMGQHSTPIFTFDNCELILISNSETNGEVILIALLIQAGIIEMKSRNLKTKNIHDLKSSLSIY